MVSAEEFPVTPYSFKLEYEVTSISDITVLSKTSNMVSAEEFPVTPYSFKLEYEEGEKSIMGHYSRHMRHLVGGSGGMLPLKTFKICASKSAFPAFWDKN